MIIHIHPSDLQNVIFYTFSTIPQVLAAFIALSGVFLVYRIIEYKKLQLTKAKTFIDNYGLGIDKLPNEELRNNFRTLKALIELNSTKKLILVMKKIMSDDFMKNLGKKYQNIVHLFQLITLIQKRKNLILFLSKVSTIIGSIAIIGSLIVLSMASDLSKNQSVSCIIIGITLATISIITMVYVIVMSFSEFDSLEGMEIN